MGFENVGRVWTPQSLRAYLQTITKPDWCNAITLHHTAEPSLAQRPHGLVSQHLNNLRDFYAQQKGWSAGPHLFADEDQLWGMTDLRKKGVHSVSFNARALGIEVLGNYDIEDPKSGRGLECWMTTAAATRALLDWLGLEANEKTVLFHRDDPKTAKTCPGKKVQKDWVLGLIARASTEEAADPHAKPDIGVTLRAADWKFVGESWCVPVLVFLRKKGVPESEVVAKLKKVGRMFYYGDELLEDAFYDLATEATWAPVRDLLDLKSGRPDLGIALNDSLWRLVSGDWYVPVRTYLLKKGIAAADIAANLKKDGASFSYGGIRIAGAFYDKGTESTWAPASELPGLLAKIKNLPASPPSKPVPPPPATKPTPPPATKPTPPPATQPPPTPPPSGGTPADDPRLLRIYTRFLNLCENDNGSPETDYRSIYIYNDGNNQRKQVTLGRGFTQDGGNLWKVLERYIDKHGAKADFFRGYQARMKDGSLWRDQTFLKTLKQCASEQAMRDAQDEIFNEVYLHPAFAWSATNGFTLPLSYGVVVDSYLHSGAMLKKLTNSFTEPVPAKGGDEKKWMKAYLEARLAWFNRATGALHTTMFRPRFFLTEIARDNWQLTGPLTLPGKGVIT